MEVILRKLYAADPGSIPGTRICLEERCMFFGLPPSVQPFILQIQSVIFSRLWRALQSWRRFERTLKFK
jgi:hypothetical protein